jgi:HEAT repeat protein
MKRHLIVVLTSLVAVSLFAFGEPAMASGNVARIRAVVEQLRGLRGYITSRVMPTGQSDGMPDPQLEKKREILKELMWAGNDAIPPLLDALKDPDWQMRKNVCQVLMDRARIWKGDDDPATQAAVLQVTDAMIEAMDDPKSGLSGFAVSIIAEIGPPAAKAVPSLIRMLGDPSDGARYGSVLALGALGPTAKAALPQLSKLLTDSNEHVRFEAKGVIEQLSKSK